MACRGLPFRRDVSVRRGRHRSSGTHIYGRRALHFWPSVPRPVAGRGPGGALGPGRVSGDCGPPGHVSSRSGSRTTTTAWALLAPAFLASLLVCTTSSNHGRFSRQLFHIQERNPDGASFRRHVGHWVSFKVALVGWTYVFDAAFGQHVRYSMTPKCWRCTVFSSVHAVPSNLEACLVLRTDHIPV